MARAPILYWPVVCLGLLAAGPGLAQSDSGRINEVLADIVDTHEDIQWTLPRSSGPPIRVQDAPVPPEPLRAPPPEETAKAQPTWLERLKQWFEAALGGWVRFLVWAMVGLGAALIAYMLWRERPGGFDSEHGDEGFAADLAPLDLTPDRITFKAAGELAGAGRHAEAIHTLLLVCLRELRRKLDLSTALTAREIARDRRLADAARTELATVSAAVERSLFGGRLVGAADYRDCLSRSQRFVASLETKNDRPR